MRTLLASISFIAFTAAAATAQETPMPQAPAPDTATAPLSAADIAAQTDPFVWMEEVEGERALTWVKAQNTRSLDALKADPRYAGFEAAALEVANSDERIPYGSIRDGQVYNFWQDKTNIRGLWRRTSLDSYRTENPEWETVLDFDALAKAEDKNWVFKGSDCFRPEGADKTLCMISLSNGGKDAVIQREFDLDTKTFVESGFVTPEAKQGTAWVDYDTQLIATDWGGDGSTLTESGYPTTVKRWTRGTDLADATDMISGEATDVGVWPMAMELEDGRILQGAVRSPTFFTSEYYWFPDDGSAAVKWPIPMKSSISGIYKGYFIFTLQQDWTPEGQSTAFKSGDLLAFNLDEFLSTKALPAVELVFRPTSRQAINGIAVSKGGALLSINDNVIGRVMKLEPSPTGWNTSPVTLPGKGQAGIAFANKRTSTVFINYEGFLTPDSLLEYDSELDIIETVKALPEKFDTMGLSVYQYEATSSDGTKVPYFVVSKEGVELDGTTPTLLYGYGGFQVSLNPSYSATIGRLWLEQGGAYVLANIRGGGEFGPDWHQAGLKQNRQLIYDDFISVGEDLITRKITSPTHLGIMGGSNGGLLMGVMLNQRPDLWNAVVVQVPLLDMLRYHTLLAGASWVDEYGDPDIAEERAFLETISPYQNFDADKPYPTPFFVTSTKDDRVHPAHARKMAAKFEAAGLPFLYYENIDGGHSAAANQQARAKRSALEFTYLASRLFAKPAEATPEEVEEITGE